jgi:hypothetical protein
VKPRRQCSQAVRLWNNCASGQASGLKLAQRRWDPLSGLLTHPGCSVDRQVLADRRRMLTLFNLPNSRHSHLTNRTGRKLPIAEDYGLLAVLGLIPATNTLFGRYGCAPRGDRQLHRLSHLHARQPYACGRPFSSEAA